MSINTRSTEVIMGINDLPAEVIPNIFFRLEEKSQRSLEMTSKQWFLKSGVSRYVTLCNNPERLSYYLFNVLNKNQTMHLSAFLPQNIQVEKRCPTELH